MLLFLAREADELKPVEVCDAVLLTAAIVAEEGTDGGGGEILGEGDLRQARPAEKFPGGRSGFTGEELAFCVVPRIVEPRDEQFARRHGGQQQMLVEGQQFRRIGCVFVIGFAIPVPEHSGFGGDIFSEIPFGKSRASAAAPGKSRFANSSGVFRSSSRLPPG